MPTARRARVISATQNSAPAEDESHFVHPASYLPASRSVYAAYSPQAAAGGLKFVEVLRKRSGVARPASRWKQSARLPQEVSPPASDRADGVLGETARGMGRVVEARRPAAFRRRIMTFQFQRSYLSLGTKLREQLAPLLPPEVSSAEQ